MSESSLFTNRQEDYLGAGVLRENQFSGTSWVLRWGHDPITGIIMACQGDKLVAVIIDQCYLAMFVHNVVVVGLFLA